MPTIVNEIWIAMALLAKENGDIRFTVTNEGLKKKVKELFNDSREGVNTHISQHVVAQKNLNTGYNKCFLSVEGRGLRRLFLPCDEIHESRKISNIQKIPKNSDIPYEYHFLLVWYKENSFSSENNTDSNIKKSYQPQNPEPSVRNDKIVEGTTFSKFINNFDKAYKNFYISNSTYKNFKKGPCIYFHKKSIDLWKKHIVNSNDNYYYLFGRDEYPEAIYATLSAWGMNRLGGGPKLKDFDAFKKNLVYISDDLEKLRKSSILSVENIKGFIKNIFSKIDPSENKLDLIAKFKTLHHLNPNIFPPVDKRYTLELFTKFDELAFKPSSNSVNFTNFWNILLCFKSIIDLVRYNNIVKYIDNEIMDTSITKIIDNAIVGFSDLSI